MLNAITVMKGLTITLSIVVCILLVVISWSAISTCTNDGVKPGDWITFWLYGQGFGGPYLSLSNEIPIPFTQATIGIPYPVFNLCFYLFFVILIILIIITNIQKKQEASSNSRSKQYSAQRTSPTSTSYSDRSSYSNASSYSDTSSYYDSYYQTKYDNQGASYYTNYGDAESGHGKYAYSDYFYNDSNKSSYSDTNRYSDYDSSGCC